MQVVKPNYTTSLVHVKAGEIIPDDFLRKLLEENRSAIGFVVQDGDKLEVEKFTTLGTVEKEFDNIKDILANTKKFQRMFCFSAFPGEFDEDEVQPWSIIRDSKKNALLVVGLEGDLPNENPDGTSEMLANIDKYLGPKIESLYKLLGNDSTKLFTALKDADAFGKDLLARVGHRGHFFFMPVKGELFAHGVEGDGNNPLSAAFAWGAASNAYGFKEDPPVEEKVPEPAPAAVSTRKVSKYATAENAEPAAPAAPPPPPAPDPAKPKTDDNGIHHIQKPKDPVEKAVDNAAATTVKGYWWEPPKDVHGKALKRLYRQMNAKNEGVAPDEGSLPQDWEKRPKIFIEAKTLPLKEGLAATAVASIPPALPTIDGKAQQAISAFVKKFLDGNSNTVPNPLETQKQEAQLAVFSELCLTQGLDEIERWKTEQIKALCTTHPDAAFLLIVELRRDRINRKATMKAGDKTLGELTGTEKPEEKPATPTVAPSPAASPAEVPVHAPRRVSKYA